MSTPQTSPRRTLSGVGPFKTRTMQLPSVKQNETRRTQGDYPRSYRDGWVPLQPVIREREALSSLMHEWASLSRQSTLDEITDAEKKLVIVDLDDFEIYRAPGSGLQSRAHELTSLHFLDVPQAKKLCFDGTLSLGSTSNYVQQVLIEACSVEGFGDDEDPGVVVYLQSSRASHRKDFDIWYRLKSPSTGYARFHEPFLWIAQLARHAVDYMENQPDGSVGLHSFRSDFYQWLSARFHGAAASDLQQWLTAFNKQSDFRVAINAYIDYIYQQAFTVPGSKKLLTHPLWGDCMTGGLRSVPQQKQSVTLTIATQFVYDCFKDMYFGGKLRVMNPTHAIKSAQASRKAELGFAKSLYQFSSHKSTPACQPYQDRQVKVGDVIAIESNEADRKAWRDSHNEWLAYVRETIPAENGMQRIFLIWLYRPHDTNMFKAKYPNQNELFFSDNCNCSETAILSSEVKGRFDVDWNPQTIDPKRYFVRQTYITQKSAFVTFNDKHKTCMCGASQQFPSNIWARGDTVYVRCGIAKNQRLEPVIVHGVDPSTGEVKVRKLLRLQRDCSELAQQAKRTCILPNELILTDEYEIVKQSQILRQCFITFVPMASLTKGQVPTLHRLGGLGDFWTISMGLVKSDSGDKLAYLAKLPGSFKEYHPNQQIYPKLRGLSIFSGGGSLDRGLEAGGAVEFHTAVDFSDEAMHTQRANARDPAKMRLFCGSVDDFLKAALMANSEDLVARIGEVDLIAGGTPCPGFSALQQDFLSAASLTNASHVTTFCSFVDLYRPPYAILENVVTMSSTRKGFEEQNVLSQLVACLVGMGYQVNQFIMDAWNHGSCQQRSRIFLCIAAPRLTPIAEPPHTHSLPYGTTAARGLGMLPNGERFGEREYYPTSFPHIKAEAATSDLPDIGNGQVHTCIPFPSHRASQPLGSDERAIITYIPKSPPGCGYKQAYEAGLIPSEIHKKGREVGRGYSRIQAAGLIPTITTVLHVRDARNGAALHWAQDRGITIQEARRAQGFSDHEPIIGRLAAQYKIVGNGVDRRVATALGVSLFRAVQKNLDRRPVVLTAIKIGGLAYMAANDQTDGIVVNTGSTVLRKKQTLAERSQKPQPNLSLLGEDRLEGLSEYPVREHTHAQTHAQMENHAHDTRHAGGPTERFTIRSQYKDFSKPTRNKYLNVFMSQNVSQYEDSRDRGARPSPVRPLSTPTSAIPNPPSFTDQEEGTQTGRSFSAPPSLSPTLPMRTKRVREDPADPNENYHAVPDNDPASQQKKRPRTAQRFSSYDEVETQIDTAETTNNGNTTVSTTIRTTRRSGVFVEFVPKRWDLPVEKAWE